MLVIENMPVNKNMMVIENMPVNKNMILIENICFISIIK